MHMFSRRIHKASVFTRSGIKTLTSRTAWRDCCSRVRSLLMFVLHMRFQVLVDMKYKDGSGNNDKEIVGMLIALLFGGQHTTSITSTWTALFAIRYYILCTSV